MFLLDQDYYYYVWFFTYAYIQIFLRRPEDISAETLWK